MELVETAVNDTTANKPIHGAGRPGTGMPGGRSVAGRLASQHAAHLAFMACMMLAGCAAMPDTGQRAAMQHLRGVVQQIEWIPEQQTDVAISGAMGAAAAGGSVPGAEPPAGFRVTLRTDDGSLQTVMVGLQPACNVGDRVTYSNGVIAR